MKNLKALESLRLQVLVDIAAYAEMLVEDIDPRLASGRATLFDAYQVAETLSAVQMRVPDLCKCVAKLDALEERISLLTPSVAGPTRRVMAKRDNAPRRGARCKVRAKAKAGGK